jgi:hypothetical protein
VSGKKGTKVPGKTRSKVDSPRGWAERRLVDLTWVIAVKVGVVIAVIHGGGPGHHL